MEAAIPERYDFEVDSMIQITNEDNMLLMARYPDKYFDLAIVDPPYFNGQID
jgi:site-specific DNA-methyltransferase (adenine-specific)